jgi:hypothetical protein
MELAATAARSKAIAESLESVAAGFEAVEKAYFDKFESEKSVALSGTVTEFLWTNPRARMVLTVNGTEKWTIEIGGLAVLARQGWRPKTVAPGMLITVVIHPLRDATHGGLLLSAILPNGEQLKGGRDRPGRLQQLRELAASAEAAKLEFVKKNQNQLLGCSIN